MNGRKQPSAVFKVATVVMAILLTLTTPSAAPADDFSHDMKIVGTLEYGQTTGGIAYTNLPKYRALKFAGRKGDLIEVWVRSATGDAVAWVLDDQFKILAMNDDADGTTVNARIALTLPGNSNDPDITTYYVVFRDYSLASANFTVSLARGASFFTPSRTGPGSPQIIKKGR